MDKKCPFHTTSDGFTRGCDEDDCGLWDDKDKRCAIVTLAKRKFVKVNKVGIEP